MIRWLNVSSPTPASIVICTDGRVEALATLHAVLPRQTHPAFEVVYVVGPTEDGSWPLVRSWAAASPGIKALRAPERNLSLSRNLGVAAAAGELVAFLDDDALPEPEWLLNLAAAFERPEVAIAGGAVYDPTGVDFQFLYSAADRLGASHHGLSAPPDAGCYPQSPLFPHVMGANFMARRAALVALCGFDEEYEYYLDETDLCARAVDAGLTVAQVGVAAPAHHKFLQNPLRTAARVLLDCRPVLKNTVYFTFRNAPAGARAADILAGLAAAFARRRADLAEAVAAGAAPPVALPQFDADADRALRVGLVRGLTGERRLAAPDRFAAPPAFARFPSAPGRACVAFLALDADNAAEAMARAKEEVRRGVDAHVLVANAPEDDVSVVEGVWLRRRAPRFAPLAAEARRLGVSEPVWRAIAAVDAELRRMAALRPLGRVVDLSGAGLSAPARWRGEAGIEARPGPPRIDPSHPLAQDWAAVWPALAG